MLDELVNVEERLRMWAEDEPREVITELRSILSANFTTLPDSLPLRKLLHALDLATRHHNRNITADTVFVEALAMTSDP